MEDVYCWEHGEETENERGLWENKRGAHWGALSITGYAQWCSLWRLDKRKIPVVLLATEEQEAEVCHYVGFEDVPNREKMLHIETQLRGTLQTTENMGRQRGMQYMLGISMWSTLKQSPFLKGSPQFWPCLHTLFPPPQKKPKKKTLRQYLKATSFKNLYLMVIWMWENVMC